MPELTNQAKSQLTGLQRVLKRYRAVMDEYVTHFNRHRPHRGRNLRPPDHDDSVMAPATDLVTAQIRRRKVLGGLIHEYERAA